MEIVRGACVENEEGETGNGPTFCHSDLTRLLV